MADKILVVEDNEAFREAARSYLEFRAGIEYARDYEEALSRLSSGYNGAVFDCFFPQKTGSGIRELGLSAVEKMALQDPEEVKIRGIISRVGEILTLDKETLPIIRVWANSSVGYNTNIEPTIRALDRCSRALGKDAAAKIARNTFGMFSQDKSYARKDYFAALASAIAESEANQPLGILLAERAEELGLPFVLATSTNHHDILTQPVCNYAGRKRWRLVDCPKDREADKGTAGFWENVYFNLQREMEARR